MLIGNEGAIEGLLAGKKWKCCGAMRSVQDIPDITLLILVLRRNNARW